MGKKNRRKNQIAKQASAAAAAAANAKSKIVSSSEASQAAGAIPVANHDEINTRLRQNGIDSQFQDEDIHDLRLRIPKALAADPRLQGKTQQEQVQQQLYAHHLHQQLQLQQQQMHAGPIQTVSNKTFYTDTKPSKIEPSRNNHHQANMNARAAEQQVVLNAQPMVRRFERKLISKSWDGVVKRMNHSHYLCDDDEDEEYEEFFNLPAPPTFQGQQQMVCCISGQHQHHQHQQQQQQQLHLQAALQQQQQMLYHQQQQNGLNRQERKLQRLYTDLMAQSQNPKEYAEIVCAAAARQAKKGKYEDEENHEDVDDDNDDEDDEYDDEEEEGQLTAETSLKIDQIQKSPQGMLNKRALLSYSKKIFHQNQVIHIAGEDDEEEDEYEEEEDEEEDDDEGDDEDDDDDEDDEDDDEYDDDDEEGTIQYTKQMEQAYSHHALRLQQVAAAAGGLPQVHTQYAFDEDQTKDKLLILQQQQHNYDNALQMQDQKRKQQTAGSQQTNNPQQHAYSQNHQQPINLQQIQQQKLNLTASKQMQQQQLQQQQHHVNSTKIPQNQNINLNLQQQNLIYQQQQQQQQQLVSLQQVQQLSQQQKQLQTQLQKRALVNQQQQRLQQQLDEDENERHKMLALQQLQQQQYLQHQQQLQKTPKMASAQTATQQPKQLQPAPQKMMGGQGINTTASSSRGCKTPSTDDNSECTSSFCNHSKSPEEQLGTPQCCDKRKSVISAPGSAVAVAVVGEAVGAPLMTTTTVGAPEKTINEKKYPSSASSSTLSSSSSPISSSASSSSLRYQSIHYYTQQKYKFLKDEYLDLEQILSKIYFEKYRYDEIKEFIYPALRNVENINNFFDILFNSIREYAEEVKSQINDQLKKIISVCRPDLIDTQKPQSQQLIRVPEVQDFEFIVANYFKQYASSFLSITSQIYDKYYAVEDFSRQTEKIVHIYIINFIEKNRSIRFNCAELHKRIFVFFVFNDQMINNYLEAKINFFKSKIVSGVQYNECLSKLSEIHNILIKKSQFIPSEDHPINIEIYEKNSEDGGIDDDRYGTQITSSQSTSSSSLMTSPQVLQQQQQATINQKLLKKRSSKKNKNQHKKAGQLVQNVPQSQAGQMMASLDCDHLDYNEQHQDQYLEQAAPEFNPNNNNGTESQKKKKKKKKKSKAAASATLQTQDGDKLIEEDMLTLPQQNSPEKQKKGEGKKKGSSCPQNDELEQFARRLEESNKYLKENQKIQPIISESWILKVKERYSKMKIKLNK